MVGACSLKHEAWRQTLQNKNCHNKIVDIVGSIDFVALNFPRTRLIETCMASYMMHNIHKYVYHSNLSIICYAFPYPKEMSGFFIFY